LDGRLLRIHNRGKRSKKSSKNLETEADPAGLCFDELDVFSTTEPCSAALNMAVDEALLEAAGTPILRFYRWAKPSLSFGYFSRYEDVAGEKENREIVRRWTGGGIVLHGGDLTYSVILPRAHLQEIHSSRLLYSSIHSAIRNALSPHVTVVLAHFSAPKVSEACFANPVVADLLLAGQKIAGAAQRRTRDGLLHQGSVQYQELPAVFPDAFAAALCAQFEKKVIPAATMRRAEEISAQKYDTSEWTLRR